MPWPNRVAIDGPQSRQWPKALCSYVLGFLKFAHMHFGHIRRIFWQMGRHWWVWVCPCSTLLLHDGACTYYFVPFFWQTIFYCMVWNIGTNSIFDELWYRKWNWISSLQVFTARHLLGRYSLGTTYVRTSKVYDCAKWWHGLFRFQIYFLFTFLILLLHRTILMMLVCCHSIDNY